MFDLQFTDDALRDFEKLKQNAGSKKSSRQAGLFKQVGKTLRFLAADPKHPGLHTHVYTTAAHPWDKNGKVFEAYVQNRTPGAYRLFWCYGPKKNQITIIAITPHP